MGKRPRCQFRGQPGRGLVVRIGECAIPDGRNKARLGGARTPDKFPSGRSCTVRGRALRRVCGSTGCSCASGRRNSPQRVAHLICELHGRAHNIGFSNGDRFELPLTRVMVRRASGSFRLDTLACLRECIRHAYEVHRCVQLHAQSSGVKYRHCLDR
jgi:hypothetical protein